MKERKKEEGNIDRNIQKKVEKERKQAQWELNK